MRTADGYRFGLQFKAASDAHRQVGEFLESLGNKKSETVVAAMVEYIRAHPEVLNTDNPVQAITLYGYSEETLRTKVEELFHEIASISCIPPINSEPNMLPETDALDTLLGVLDQFQ